MEALLGALRPSPPLAAHVDTIHAALRVGSSASAPASASASASLPAYDAIHLRYERDWWPMCDYWKAHPYVSPDPAHCGLWQPADLVSMLHRDFHLGQQPLYLAVDEEAVDDPSLLPLMRQAAASKGDLHADSEGAPGVLGTGGFGE